MLSSNNILKFVRELAITITDEDTLSLPVGPFPPQYVLVGVSTLSMLVIKTFINILKKYIYI